MLDGASIHHGIEKYSVARRLDDIHARAIARPARKRGTILFSSESAGTCV
jgi:hypothetical protein